MTPEAFRESWSGKKWRKEADGALGKTMLAVVDEFARAERAKWKPGDLVAGGAILLARAQGHDDIRELLFKILLMEPPVPESEPTYEKSEE